MGAFLPRLSGAMTMKRIQQLHSGDQVVWTDPDTSSEQPVRTITIGSIRVKGEVISITDVDGSELECYARELS